MSDKPAKPEAQPAKPGAPAAASPEADAAHRVAELQAKVAALQQEVAVLRGRTANRDPKLLGRLKQENEQLLKRFQVLKKTLFAIITESCGPRTADEEKLQYETLRVAAVEYCKKAKLDPEIWKSIAS